MNAGIAAVERAVVPREAVRIRIGRRELHRLEQAAALRVVFVQPGALLAAGDEPDRAVVKRRGVCARHAVRNQEFRLPRLRIDAQNAAQPQRRDVQLAVDPLDAVAAAAAERNLTMADRLAAHVGLEDAVRRGVRAHPDVAAADGHAAGVLRFGLHRFEQLAMPVHEAGVVALLLGDPQAVLRRGDRVGIALGTLEERRHLRLAGRDGRGAAAGGLRTRGLRARDLCAEQTDAQGGKKLSSRFHGCRPLLMLAY